MAAAAASTSSLGSGSGAGPIRRYPRRQFKARVGVLARGKYQICESQDIGEGGIAVISEANFGQGQRLLVSFQIPAGDVSAGDFVSLIGTVLTVRKAGGQYLHGISFDELAFNHKRQIRAFVASKKFR